MSLRGAETPLQELPTLYFTSKESTPRYGFVSLGSVYAVIGVQEVVLGNSLSIILDSKSQYTFCNGDDWIVYSTSVIHSCVSTEDHVLVKLLNTGEPLPVSMFFPADKDVVFADDEFLHDHIRLG